MRLQHAIPMILMILAMTLSSVASAQSASDQSPFILRLKKSTADLHGTPRYQSITHEALMRDIRNLPARGNTDDSLHIYIYHYAEAMLVRGNLQQAILMARESFTWSVRKKDEVRKGLCYLLMARIHMAGKAVDSVRWYLAKAEAWKDVNNYFLQISLLSVRGDVAAIDNKHYKALSYYNEVIKMLKAENDSYNAAIIGMNLAETYFGLKNYKKAIALSHQYLPFFEKLKVKSQLATYYSNLGVYYQNADSLSASLSYHSKSLDFARSLGDSMAMARTYSNLGNLQRKRKEYSSSAMYHDSALWVCEKLGLPFGIFINHINRAELYLAQEQWSDALRFLLLGRNMKEFYSIPLYRAEVDESLSRAFQGLGRWQDAFHYNKQATKVTDSLEGLETEMQLQQMDELYEYEKTSRQLAEMKEKAAFATLQSRLLLFLVAIFTIGVLFFLYRLRLKRQLEMARQKLVEEEKERLVLSVKSKDQELFTQAAQQASIRELAQLLKTELIKLELVTSKNHKAVIKALIEDIEDKTAGDQWTDFELRFAQVNEELYKSLHAITNELSPTELKICGLLRLNMTSKEIALLTNRSVATIDNNRSTIRRKLHLPSDINLTTFLLSL